MNQDKAQKIICDTYGANAYAIGHTAKEDSFVIFWLYAGEDEDACKAHEVKA